MIVRPSPKPFAPLTPAALGAALGGQVPAPGARIGLLGGSFNPAHDGHLEISQEALRRLGLDRVWWLVSPQNPLKSRDGMAPLNERLAGARRAATDPRILPTGLEAALGTAYTADTLQALTRLLPQVRFIWLMGADNLIQVHNWQAWQKIFNTVAVAVFDRPSYASRALSGKAALSLARHRLNEGSARRLAEERPPAWVFIRCRLNPRSATDIRAASDG
ncbi:nicotinate-nucleotide adenylyltransferase [Pelagibius litoralis]|uniref:Probable nicotinate-nucleotide adenylyltransferase n=1 Tax=Pelagibius litoralis TaxID=374515 RepID=A0A967CBE5_9PROT|nr:nicotinate-nucleotide adenylyltransferase [Pelagibius litoralis]NIA68293.1 nicotinate-nucleotide adenylyltransferase [Pelagibius litoralis]